MKKLITTLIILLLAGIYLPGCSADKTNPSDDPGNKPTETASGSTGTSGVNPSPEVKESDDITISIPKSDLKDDKNTKVILIKKIANEWTYTKADISAINFGWILLAFVGVFSLAVNSFIIFKRKGR